MSFAAAKQGKREEKLSGSLSALHCVVCLDTAVPNPRILQCSNGHLLCEECHVQVMGRNGAKCPVCRVKIVNPIRALLAEQMIDMRGLLGTCKACDSKHRLDTEHRCPKCIVCPLKTLGVCDCDAVLEAGNVATHLETVHDIKSYAKVWHGYSCRFKIKTTRFTHCENSGYKMVILNLQKNMDSSREFRVGDDVTTDNDHSGHVVEVNSLHARVVCEDNRSRYFGLSQLTLKHPRFENTKILSVIGEGDQLAVFNLSDHERKVQCEAKIEINHSGMSDSHVLDTVMGYTKEQPFQFVPAVKKLSLAIRTAEPITRNNARDVLLRSVERARQRRREDQSMIAPSNVDSRHQTAMNNTLRQWRERIRGNQRASRDRMQAAAADRAADIAARAALPANRPPMSDPVFSRPPVPMVPVDRQNPRFYDSLVEGVRRRGDIVSQIAQNLEDPDLDLSPDARTRLENELRQHRVETETDLIILQQEQENNRQFLPRPGDSNPSLDVLAPSSQPRGSNVTVSSNNTAIDMDVSEMEGVDSELAEQVDRILGEMDG